MNARNLMLSLIVCSGFSGFMKAADGVIGASLAAAADAESKRGAEAPWKGDYGNLSNTRSSVRQKVDPSRITPLLPSQQNKLNNSLDSLSAAINNGTAREKESNPWFYWPSSKEVSERVIMYGAGALASAVVGMIATGVYRIMFPNTEANILTKYQIIHQNEVAIARQEMDIRTQRTILTNERQEFLATNDIDGLKKCEQKEQRLNEQARFIFAMQELNIKLREQVARQQGATLDQFLKQHAKNLSNAKAQIPANSPALVGKQKA